ncbi:MAG: antibiotic biosynthesis monooxygenase [Thermoanaerobaculia bacterium]
MILRIWHGWTNHENADAYQQTLIDEVFPGIAAKNVRGYRGIELLRRDSGQEVEFVTIMRFDSLDAVREFAGEDYRVSYVPAKPRTLLSRFDAHAAHYELCHQGQPAPRTP